LYQGWKHFYAGDKQFDIFYPVYLFFNPSLSMSIVSGTLKIMFTSVCLIAIIGNSIFLINVLQYNNVNELEVSFANTFENGYNWPFHFLTLILALLPQHRY
jgi:hypothetical protein